MSAIEKVFTETEMELQEERGLKSKEEAEGRTGKEGPQNYCWLEGTDWDKFTILRAIMLYSKQKTLCLPWDCIFAVHHKPLVLLIERL